MRPDPDLANESYDTVEFFEAIAEIADSPAMKSLADNVEDRMFMLMPERAVDVAIAALILVHRGTDGGFPQTCKRVEDRVAEMQLQWRARPPLDGGGERPR